MSVKIFARELLGYPAKSLLTVLPPKFTLVFDDGEYTTTRRRTCASAFFWEYHRQFPKTPLSQRHHFQHVFKGKNYNSNSHLDICQEIEKDIWPIYEKEDEELINKTSKISYDSSIQMTNELMEELAPYVAPFDLLDAIEINRHPRIQEAISKASPDGRSVVNVYDVVHDMIMNDPSLVHNALAKAYRNNTVKREQVLQTVSFRGVPTEPNGQLFKLAVLTGYLEGMTRIYDFVTDSRSAPKAQMSAEAPLQDSEYMARRLQFLVSVVKQIKGNDCGSTKLIRWLVEPEVRDPIDNSLINKDGIGPMAGKFIEDPETGNLIELTGKETHLNGKYVRMRSVLTCQNEDPHTVCKTCFGGLSRNYYAHANLGHLCCVTITEKITQNTLSTKHKVATGEGARIQLNNISKKYFDVGKSKVDYLLKPYLKDMQVKIAFNRSEAPNLEDVTRMENVDDLRVVDASSIEDVVITVRDKGMDIGQIVSVNQGSRKAYMSLDFVKHIRKVGYKTDEHNNFLIELKDWDYKKPVLSMPHMEISYSEYGQEVGKMIESNMSQIEERQKPDSPVNTLQELSALVNSKLDIPLPCLEVIIYASMMREKNNPALARNAPNPILGVARQLIYSRSLSCAYSFQGHSEFMLHAKAFFAGYRVSNPMDIFFSEKVSKIVEENIQN